MDEPDAKTLEAEVMALASRLRQKIERAAKLGSDLADEIQAWVRTGLTTRTVIADDRLSWEVLVEAADPPFDVWGRHFGDALHNLRSALDNLVWGLATLGGIVPQRPASIQFPIVEDRSDWLREARRIAEVPEAARRVIEGVQPFQRSGPDGVPASDGLLVLHRLNILDKHRFVLQPLIQPEEVSHAFSVEFRSDEEAAMNVPPDVTLSADFLIGGTPIIKHITKTPIARVQGEFAIKAQVMILNEAGVAFGVTTLLAGLVQYVPTVMDCVLAAVLQPLD